MHRKYWLVARFSITLIPKRLSYHLDGYLKNFLFLLRAAYSSIPLLSRNTKLYQLSRWSSGIKIVLQNRYKVIWKFRNSNSSSQFIQFNNPASSILDSPYQIAWGIHFSHSKCSLIFIKASHRLQQNKFNQTI